MTTATATITTLFEQTNLQSSRVDREAGVIRNVKILGRVSKNGRIYSRPAMKDAAKLYEGIRVNIDHPPRHDPERERSFSDTIGQIRNVRIEDDSIRGDIHYNRSHAMADALAESAERFSNTLGLSHNAKGETRQADGQAVVEAVTRVLSVDIVGIPATSSGLFESSILEEEDSQRDESELLPEEFVSRLKSLLSQAGIVLLRSKPKDPSAKRRAFDKLDIENPNGITARFLEKLRDALGLPDSENDETIFAEPPDRKPADDSGDATMVSESLPCWMKRPKPHTGPLFESDEPLPCWMR